MIELSVLEIPDEFVWRVLVETLVSLLMAGWALGWLRSGRWGASAFAGAVLFLAVNAVYLAAYAIPQWLETSTDLLPWVINHPAPLAWTKIGALALFVLAVTVGRRQAGSTR